MKLYDTLTELFADVKDRDREIRFIDGDRDESSLRFGELWDASLALLGSLQARGMKPGDELIIFSKSNQSFVIAFWAAVLGGLVPVPVAVGISDEHKLKLFRILSQLENPTLFTEMDLLQRLLDYAKEIERADITELLDTHAVLISDVAPGSHGEVHPARPEDTGFIQYSSGSTSDPKGVVLSHRNLCVNIRAIVEALGWGEDDQALSWMPLTHDMGLIGYHLSVMAAGMNHAVMDTNVFVRRPLLWMTKASELRATQLCSPNFGYKHFLKLFERKGLPEDVDLSRVKRILNGAEPISWDLCEEFLTALAPFGLKRNTMLPVYGLAEATVGVTSSPLGPEYERVVMDRHSLQIGETYHAVDPSAADAVSFIKVGTPMRDVRLRIADDADAVLSDGHIGHIQLQGGSVTERVYGDAAATAELFTGDGWLQDRRLRCHCRWQPGHYGPAERHHHRQRPELLPARYRGDHRATSRSRPQQGGRCGRHTERRADRGAGCFHPAPAGRRRFPAADRPGTQHCRRACGPRGRHRDSGGSYPEDDERQGPAREAAGSLFRRRI